MKKTETLGAVTHTHTHTHGYSIKIKDELIDKVLNRVYVTLENKKIDNIKRNQNIHKILCVF